MAFLNRVSFRQLDAFRVLLLQIVISLLLSGVTTLMYGQMSGYSMLLGGSIAWIPAAWFAYKAFRYYGARSVQAIVRSFWSGLSGKMILTAVMFALAFTVVKPLSVPALFVGYLVVQMTGLASSLLLVK